MMKRRNVLLSAAVCILLTGCGGSSVVYEPLANHTNPVRTEKVTAETETVTQTDAVSDSESEPEPAEPSELDQRVAAIYELQPVPIPEEGWTDETLLPVISVAGKPMEMPIPLSELLFGYRIEGDDAEYYASCADRIFTDSVWLAGDGIVLFSVFSDGRMPEDQLPSTLPLSGDWIVPLSEDKVRRPFTVNCIGIGSTLDELTNQLGVPDIGEDSGLVRLEIRTDSVRISVRGAEETVHTISVQSTD